MVVIFITQDEKKGTKEKIACAFSWGLNAVIMSACIETLEVCPCHVIRVFCHRLLNINDKFLFQMSSTKIILKKGANEKNCLRVLLRVKSGASMYINVRRISGRRHQGLLPSIELHKDHFQKKQIKDKIDCANSWGLNRVIMSARIQTSE